MNAFELTNVTKRFEPSAAVRTTALDAVTLAVPRRSIVGLIGRNGSGKSTLLRHVTGLLLPDSGECVTLGRPAAKLSRAELTRIGVVDQHAGFIDWMYVEQLVRYVSTFYTTWDRTLERELLELLDVDPAAYVGAMSQGHVQRVALVLAVCHHPELLLLDEPLSDVDPIARQQVLALLLDRFSSENMTMVVSSHLLRDIEPVVNRIVCLHEGRVVADDDTDALCERYAEWIVTSPGGLLPAEYGESFVVAVQGDAHGAARVLVALPLAAMITGPGTISAGRARVPVAGLDGRARSHFDAARGDRVRAARADSTVPLVARLSLTHDLLGAHAPIPPPRVAAIAGNGGAVAVAARRCGRVGDTLPLRAPGIHGVRGTAVARAIQFTRVAGRTCPARHARRSARRTALGVIRPTGSAAAKEFFRLIDSLPRGSARAEWLAWWPALVDRLVDEAHPADTRLYVAASRTGSCSMGVRSMS